MKRRSQRTGAAPRSGALGHAIARGAMRQAAATHLSGDLRAYGATASPKGSKSFVPGPLKRTR